MFGFSAKEKLQKEVIIGCDKEISQFESDFRKLNKELKEQGKDFDQKRYMEIVGNYSYVAIQEINKKLTEEAKLRSQMIMFQSNFTAAGLPKEVDVDFLIENGPMVGYLWALNYYYITGKKIAEQDYIKFIRPLNEYQNKKINEVIDKIEKEEDREMYGAGTAGKAKKIVASVRQFSSITASRKEVFPNGNGNIPNIECVLIGISCFIAAGFANDNDLAYEIIPTYQKEIMKDVSKAEYDRRSQLIQNCYSEFRDLSIRVQEREKDWFNSWLLETSKLAAEKYNAATDMNSITTIGASIKTLLETIDPRFINHT